MTEDLTAESLLAAISKVSTVGSRPTVMIVPDYQEGWLRTYAAWCLHDWRRVKRELRKYSKRYRAEQRRMPG